DLLRPHLAEVDGRLHRKTQRARAEHAPSCPCCITHRPEEVQQQRSSHKIAKSPQYIAQRRRLAHSRRLGKRRLEGIAADALHKMRNSIGQKRTTQELQQIKIPVHRRSSLSLSYC